MLIFKNRNPLQEITKRQMSMTHGYQQMQSLRCSKIQLFFFVSLSPLCFVFNNLKACSIVLRSGDWLGCWRIFHFFSLRRSWFTFAVCFWLITLVPVNLGFICMLFRFRFFFYVTFLSGLEGEKRRRSARGREERQARRKVGRKDPGVDKQEQTTSRTESWYEKNRTTHKTQLKYKGENPKWT